MKMEITSVSTSKKGTVWIQAKVVCDMKAEDLKVGDQFQCSGTESEKSKCPDIDKKEKE